MGEKNRGTPTNEEEEEVIIDRYLSGQSAGFTIPGNLSACRYIFGNERWCGHKSQQPEKRRHDHFPGGLSWGFSSGLQAITIVVVCYYFYLVLLRESRSTAKAVAAVDSSGGHAMKTTLFLSSSAVVDRENCHFDGH